MQIGPKEMLNIITCKNINKIIMLCLYESDKKFICFKSRRKTKVKIQTIII